VSSITPLYGWIRAPGVLGPGVGIGGSTPQGCMGGSISRTLPLAGSAECTRARVRVRVRA
jgi:hypothetical protein